MCKKIRFRDRDLAWQSALYSPPRPFAPSLLSRKQRRMNIAQASAAGSSTSPGCHVPVCIRPDCSNPLELGPFNVCRSCRARTQRKHAEKQKHGAAMQSTKCLSCFVPLEVHVRDAGQPVMCADCHQRKAAVKRMQRPIPSNAPYTQRERAAIAEADAFTEAAASFVHPANMDVLLNSRYRSQLEPPDERSQQIAHELIAPRVTAPVNSAQHPVVPPVPPPPPRLSPRGVFMVFTAGPSSQSPRHPPKPTPRPIAPRSQQKLANATETRSRAPTTPLRMCMTYGCGAVLTEDHPTQYCLKCVAQRERLDPPLRAPEESANASSPASRDAERASKRSRSGSPMQVDASIAPDMSSRAPPAAASQPVRSTSSRQLLASTSQVGIPVSHRGAPQQQDPVSLQSAPTDVPVTTSAEFAAFPGSLPPVPPLPSFPSVTMLPFPYVPPPVLVQEQHPCSTDGCTGTVPRDSRWGRCVQCGMKRWKERFGSPKKKTDATADTPSAVAEEKFSEKRQEASHAKPQGKPPERPSEIQHQKSLEKSHEISLVKPSPSNTNERELRPSLAEEQPQEGAAKDPAHETVKASDTAASKPAAKQHLSPLQEKSNEGPALSAVPDQSPIPSKPPTSPLATKPTSASKQPSSPVRAKAGSTIKMPASPTRAKAALASKPLISSVRAMPQRSALMDRRPSNKGEDNAPAPAPIRERLVLRIPARPRPSAPKKGSDSASPVSSKDTNVAESPSLSTPKSTAESPPASATSAVLVDQLLDEHCGAPSADRDVANRAEERATSIIDKLSMLERPGADRYSAHADVEASTTACTTAGDDVPCATEVPQPMQGVVSTDTTDNNELAIPETEATPVSPPSLPPPSTSPSSPTSPTSSAPPLSSAALEWDSNNSDLTSLEDSPDEDEGESEIDLPESGESDEEPLLAGYAKSGPRARGRPRARPTSPEGHLLIHYTRCIVLSCQNMLSPNANRNLCEPCRDRIHRCQRKGVIPDIDIPQGYRFCGIRFCYNVLPPMWDYQWKMCEPCRWRARARKRARKKRLQGIDNSEPPRRDHPPKHVYAGSDGLTSQHPMTGDRPSTEDLTVHKRKRHQASIEPPPQGDPGSRAPQYQHLSALLDDVRTRFYDFMLGQAQYLRYKFKHQSHDNPVYFNFDGEYSVVADPAGGLVDALVAGVVADMQTATGLSFQKSCVCKGPEDSVITRFGCMHDLQVPLTFAPTPAQMKPPPVPHLLLKRMAGEIDVSVSWDRSRAFVPGQRILVRFRLAG